MIPKEVLNKVEYIKITTSHMVTDVFAGQYHSLFKGKGMEFDEVREYFPGDDIRSIDWNVTARTGIPHVKKFVEERELTVMILLDMSASLCFGSVDKLKSELAAEISALLAFAAIKNNDKVGLIGFTDGIEIFLPPRKGVKHIMRIIREALYFKPEGRKTDIKQAIDYLNNVTTRKTVTFVISDFYDFNYKSSLAIAGKRHDIVAIAIDDLREEGIPDIGIASFADRESGREVTVDTGSRAFREGFIGNRAKIRNEREQIFKSIGIDFVTLSTSRPYDKDLFKFFRQRGRRIRK